MKSDEACVGIFWFVPGDDQQSKLVTDMTVLAVAEPYGDCMTHPRGHYEVWEEWRQLRDAHRSKLEIPKSTSAAEYEEYPRGRVVYHLPTDTFWIYADARIQNRSRINAITMVFGLLNRNCVVKSDTHYQ